MSIKVPFDFKPNFITRRQMMPTHTEAQKLVAKINATTRDNKGEGVIVCGVDVGTERFSEVSIVEWEEGGEERFAVDVITEVVR